MQRKASGLVAIACNFAESEGHKQHRTGHRYVTAVLEAAGATPVLVPAIGERGDFDALLERIDGVLLTGGVSNVEPHHYDGEPSREGVPHDAGRDGIAFRLIHGCIERGMPLLGVCRGIQEINVAFGGTLHQHLHEVPGRFDHRRQREKPIEEQLAPRQRLNLTPGGLFQRLAGGATEITVNSLHGQGIDRVGDGLIVEAVADDGTIEGIRVEAARSFAVGVQWHAEYEPLRHPFYGPLFRAFGDAVAAHAAGRGGAASAAGLGAVA